MSTRITEALNCVTHALMVLPLPSDGPGKRAWTSLLEAQKLLAALSADPGEAEGWRDIPVTAEVLDYVSKYGGRCRDCADNFGVCPCGLPCKYEERRTAIRHVLNAINYGMTHGYLAADRSALEPDNAG